MTATTTAPTPAAAPAVVCTCGNPARSGVPDWHTAHCPALTTGPTKQCATAGCTALLSAYSFEHCRYHDPDGAFEQSVARRGEALAGGDW